MNDRIDFGGIDWLWAVVLHLSLHSLDHMSRILFLTNSTETTRALINQPRPSGFKIDAYLRNIISR